MSHGSALRGRSVCADHEARAIAFRSLASLSDNLQEHWRAGSASILCMCRIRSSLVQATGVQRIIRVGSYGFFPTAREGNSVSAPLSGVRRECIGSRQLITRAAARGIHVGRKERSFVFDIQDSILLDRRLYPREQLMVVMQGNHVQARRNRA